MKLKNSISDYTESEFIDFMHEIDKENIAETDDKLDVLLNHFEKSQSTLLVQICFIMRNLTLIVLQKPLLKLLKSGELKTVNRDSKG